ncbi:TPA: DNA-directed RNA polymerase subunit omega, partial [Enterococcus faecium]|nr:DNA-directed RNA polymerase subunit omega [Enterococcus faecium]HBM7155594.1 DNA-directed RNA polymerase subunit omega [Enterococcus faecium]HCK3994278.1 DNA-directed RNA polymerase subunit omega [Enterococcus faecium]
LSELQNTVNGLNQQIATLTQEKTNVETQLTDTQKKLDEATAENSSLKQYIQKLEKAKDEVEDTADKSQQIVEEHLRK